MVACGGPVQVMPEIKGHKPLTVDWENLEDLTEEEKVDLASMQDTVQSCLKRFLGHEPGSVCVTKKLYRQATWRFLQLGGFLQAIQAADSAAAGGASHGGGGGGNGSRSDDRCRRAWHRVWLKQVVDFTKNAPPHKNA